MRIVVLGAGFGGLEGPSTAFAEDKVDFGASRVRRWFDQQ